MVGLRKDSLFQRFNQKKKILGVSSKHGLTLRKWEGFHQEDLSAELDTGDKRSYSHSSLPSGPQPQKDFPGASRERLRLPLNCDPRE